MKLLPYIQVLRNKRPPQPYFHPMCYRAEKGDIVLGIYQLPNANVIPCTGCEGVLTEPPRHVEQLTLF